MQAEPLRLTVPAVLAALPRLLALVDAACDRHGADAATRHDLRLLAEEACVNVMRHGYAAGAPGALTLEVTLETPREGDRLLLTIVDQGVPFDPTGHAAPDLALPAEARTPGGLGVHLIRTLADTVRYRRDPALGNVLTIVKHLSSTATRPSSGESWTSS